MFNSDEDDDSSDSLLSALFDVDIILQRMGDDGYGGEHAALELVPPKHGTTIGTKLDEVPSRNSTRRPLIAIEEPGE